MFLQPTIRRATFSFGLAMGLLLVPVDVGAQGHGGGGGGDSGCGDVLGDLIHIKRQPRTGQAILLKKWIEYPQDIYDWGYCPIPIDANGQELELLPLTCDPADPNAVVEVDYFGRLSAGRTKERNLRMHFNEVIVGIKASEAVTQDPSGRLLLGSDCSSGALGAFQCTTWTTVDSPVENLGIYARLMRYGHIQTDPEEVDVWAHGDPALGVEYHPALESADYAKFLPPVQHLLPGTGTPSARAAACFATLGGGFNADCARPEYLDNRDFIRAASWLAGAAAKDGVMTNDLLQYMNRILKITTDTPESMSTLATLPALILDCGDDPEAPLPRESCALIPADASLPWPANEIFVDYSAAFYDRATWRSGLALLLKPVGTSRLFTQAKLDLLSWLRFVNGEDPATTPSGMDAFREASSDGLRLNQLLHEYAIPADLGWSFR